MRVPWNEDMRVKFPATIQFMKLGYNYQSLKDAEIHTETRIFLAAVDHHRDHQRADGGDRSHSGTGDSREEEAGNDRDQTEAAGVMTDKGLAEVDDAVGDTALAHDVAGEHEERDRQQGKGVASGEDAGNVAHNGISAVNAQNEIAQKNAECHRQMDQDADQKDCQ